MPVIFDALAKKDLGRRVGCLERLISYSPYAPWRLNFRHLRVKVSLYHEFNHKEPRKARKGCGRVLLSTDYPEARGIFDTLTNPCNQCRHIWRNLWTTVMKDGGVRLREWKMDN